MTTAAQPQPTLDALLARGWAALPAGYRIPEVAPTLDEARAWCRQLAESHYENFHVATWFLPKALRPHFHAIYAYCRVSDDLGDEVGDRAVGPRASRSVGPRARRLLRRPRAPSRLCRAGRNHPRLLHSQRAVCRSARRLSPGSDRHPLRHHGRGARLLPLLGQSRRPPGALRLRRSVPEKSKKTSASPTPPAPRCNSPTSGRMCASTSPKDRVYLPQDDMRRFGVSDETIAQRRRHAGVSRPAAPRSRLRALALRAGPAADRHGQPRPGARSRSLQPRRPGDSARHRAPRLRRAQRAARHLQSAPSSRSLCAPSAAKRCHFCASVEIGSKSTGKTA